MNYNSFTFWALFLAVFVPYWWLSHKRQNHLLLVASYVFYGFWDYRFLFLVLISTYIDYIGGLGVAGRRVSTRKLLGLSSLLVVSALLLCSNVDYGGLWSGLTAGNAGLILQSLPHRLQDFGVLLGTAAASIGYLGVLPWLYARPEAIRRKAFLVISMVANLAILGFFKYCDFFIGSFVSALETLGLGHWNTATLGILLPAGISFYTFQAMSYTIDIYRGEAEPTDDFADFSLFVCFFPHLVAGPIMRAHTLLPQVVQPRTVRLVDWEAGLYLVLIGLFKKIVVADNMAPLANDVFNRFASHDTGGLTGAEVLVGVYAFALQIYGDFSGYSAVARGISKWLGFELAVNFRLPYLAVSPSDFWQRWHISLSSWLRDYLYVPLGGNRWGTAITYRNLLLTMLLGGLWHGANWTFIAWGFYHGAILCVFRWLKIRDPHPAGSAAQRLHWLLRVVLMFHLTCIGWLLFRADRLDMAAAMTWRILTAFQLGTAVLPALSLIAFYSGGLCLLEVWTRGEDGLPKFLGSPWPVRGTAYAYVLAMMLVFHATTAFEFIYFQF